MSSSASASMHWFKHVSRKCVCALQRSVRVARLALAHRWHKQSATCSSSVAYERTSSIVVTAASAPLSCRIDGQRTR